MKSTSYSSFALSSLKYRYIFTLSPQLIWPSLSTTYYAKLFLINTAHNLDFIIINILYTFKHLNSIQYLIVIIESSSWTKCEKSMNFKSTFYSFDGASIIGMCVSIIYYLWPTSKCWFAHWVRTCAFVLVFYCTKLPILFMNSAHFIFNT